MILDIYHEQEESKKEEKETIKRVDGMTELEYWKARAIQAEEHLDSVTAELNNITTSLKHWNEFIKMGNDFE